MYSLFFLIKQLMVFSPFLIDFFSRRRKLYEGSIFQNRLKLKQRFHNRSLSAKMGTRTGSAGAEKSAKECRLFTAVVESVQNRLLNFAMLLTPLSFALIDNSYGTYLFSLFFGKTLGIPTIILHTIFLLAVKLGRTDLLEITLKVIVPLSSVFLFCTIVDGNRINLLYSTIWVVGPAAYFVEKITGNFSLVAEALSATIPLHSIGSIVYLLLEKTTDDLFWFKLIPVTIAERAIFSATIFFVLVAADRSAYFLAQKRRFKSISRSSTVSCYSSKI